MSSKKLDRELKEAQAAAKDKQVSRADRIKAVIRLRKERAESIGRKH